MPVQMGLGPRVSLGSGQSIQPPDGWVQEGWIEENPLWLKPKNRIYWHPPAIDNVSLHWNLSALPVSTEIINYFLTIIAEAPDTVALEKLKPLYPTILRISLNRITQARIITKPQSTPMLFIEYETPEFEEFGIVYYSPTDKSQFGEFQILGYEGKEPEYSTYKPIAMTAMETFSTEHPATIDKANTSVKAARKDKFPPSISSVAISKSEPNKPAKVRRKTTDLQVLPTNIHVLQPGETIKAIISKRWPGLDDKEAEAKLREIYVINRIHKNTIEAWNLKPGMKIYLPDE